MNVGEIKKICVIGSGAMGSQIASLLARVGGFTVHLADIKEEIVQKGLEAIEDGLERFFVKKNKMTETEKNEILKKIKGYTDIKKAVSDVDFAIEAVPEILSLKQDIFKKLDEFSSSTAILATNTSMLNITEIASATRSPERVVGMHFFNPVAVMKLVEVVKGAKTADKVVERTYWLAEKLGKKPVICRDTSYGFLANRAYEALRLEAVQMVWEKVASPEDIDKSLKLGYNLPLGPLELGDLVGSWKRRAEMEEDRVRELGEKGRLHPLIKAMVRAGYYGGPGNKGIYDFWKEVISKW